VQTGLETDVHLAGRTSAKCKTRIKQSKIFVSPVRHTK